MRQPSPTPVALTIDAHATPEYAPTPEMERYYAQRFERLAATPYVDYPNQVGIESQAVCNASCDFCPYPTMERRGDRMSDELIEKILADLGDMPRDLPFDINLARINEPFTDRRLLDIAGEINTRLPQASIWLFTNVSALVPKVVERLTTIDRITIFVISFNDHRREQYERVMGLKYDRAVRHIDHLHELHARDSLPFTPIVSRVGDGSADDKDFLAWCRDRWPRFESRVTQRFDWIGAVDVTTYGAIPRTGCWEWYRLPILASGRVAHCALDHEGAHAWGDANDRHVLEIYNDPRRKRLRTAHADRGTVDLCSDCNHYG